MKQWITFVLILMVVGSAQAQTKVPISRSFMGFTLTDKFENLRLKKTFKLSNKTEATGEETYYLDLVSTSRWSTGAIEPTVKASTDEASSDLNYYLAAIQAKVSSRWVAPVLNLQPGQMERVTVRFTVLRSGLVRDIQLLTPSKSVFMDRSALRAVEEAIPLPPLPPIFSQEAIPVYLDFSVRAYPQPEDPLDDFRKDVHAIYVYSIDGLLYKFNIYFNAMYSARVGWNAFIASAEEKYGPPLIKSHDSISWGDDKTSLTLVKVDKYSEYSKSMVTLLVASYTDIKLYNEVDRRKKALAPKF